MKCPRCDVEMNVGIAINVNGGRYIAPCVNIIDYNSLEIIKCWKCPKCGHSDDGEGSYWKNFLVWRGND